MSGSDAAEAPGVPPPSPAGPLLFVSYGMAKTGSTLAFECMRVLHEAQGWRQDRVPRRLLDNPSPINLINEQSDLRVLRRFAATRRRRIVLKTHAPPDPVAAQGLREGWLAAHAVWRDPRDMALSLRDAGARARAAIREGRRGAFSHIVTLEDALRAIARQLAHLSQWTALPGVRLLSYDEIAFDAETAVARMADHAGLPANPAAIIAEVTGNRFTQFNKGRKARHLDEMDPGTAARIAADFAPLLAAALAGRAAEAQALARALRARLRREDEARRPDPDPGADPGENV